MKDEKEVMALPVWDPYERWVDERGVLMQRLKCVTAGAISRTDDDLVCVIAKDGLWRPVQYDGVWYRQRMA